MTKAYMNSLQKREVACCFFALHNEQLARWVCGAHGPFLNSVSKHYHLKPLSYCRS